MKTTDYIRDKVNTFAKGYVFTYEDFLTEVNKKEAVIKALNRMVASGKLTKLSKGKYYKPEKTIFGDLDPSQYQVVKDLLESNGKVIGYLTGYSIYNKFGFTTQVSNVIQIGRNDIRPSFKRGNYSIEFSRQKNTISKENNPLLQLLDIIKTIKKIPDCTIKEACSILLIQLKEKSLEDLKRLVKLSMNYPPSTRALLGAALDELKQNEITQSLLASLNPITSYEFTGAEKVFKSTEKWNIK